MLNVIAIQGRLARDPELRQTTTGKSVASFTVACDRGRRDANGQSTADWIPVVAWDARAEFVCKYFQKGSMIAVDGRLQSRTYTAKDGTNRTVLEIVANNIHFCGSKAESAAPAGSPAAAAPAQGFAPVQEDWQLCEDEGDLPF